MSKHAGKNAAIVIRVARTDVYPLLIGLTLHHGQIKVARFIGGGHLPSDALNSLIDTCDAFAARAESHDLGLAAILEPNWEISPSTFSTASPGTSEFREVAQHFRHLRVSIIRIQRIHNFQWFSAYTQQKRIVDARLGHSSSDQLLFHGCPYAAAEEILRVGFDHGRIGTIGALSRCESSAKSSFHFRFYVGPGVLLFDASTDERYLFSTRHRYWAEKNVDVSSTGGSDQLRALLDRRMSTWL